MEFEDNKPVSDADRRHAEAKKLVLQPMHTDIAPEALSNSEIATRHITEPPINNSPNDTEEMAIRMMPTKSALDTQAVTTLQTYKLLTGIIFGIVIFAGLAMFALLK